jgi:hypothetical protein
VSESLYANVIYVVSGKSAKKRAPTERYASLASSGKFGGRNGPESNLTDATSNFGVAGVCANTTNHARRTPQAISRFITSYLRQLYRSYRADVEALVLARSFDVIDDEDFDWTLRGLEL